MARVTVTDAAALEENRSLQARLLEEQAAEDPVETVPVELTRRRRRWGGGGLPAPTRLRQAWTEEIPSRAGGVGLRVLAPPGAHRGFLHFHGGGWALGSADSQDLVLWQFAERAGAVVFSVDYRLAPEHRHPAAADDCEDAADWLTAVGADRFGLTELSIGGDSAGAHLALLTLLRLRDRGDGGRFGSALLAYGPYDLGGTDGFHAWGDRRLVLSPPMMEWYIGMYLPPGSRRRVDSVSPLFADLTGTPPTLLSVGTADPLYEDSVLLHDALERAGTEVRLDVYPEAPHNFRAFDLHSTKVLISREAEFAVEHPGHSPIGSFSS